MQGLRATLVAAIAAGGAILAASVGPATATEGYFRNAYGARYGGLAGAGVADSRDATAASLNPAGLVHAPNEIDLAFTIFSPNRAFNDLGGGPGFTPSVDVWSDHNIFVMPNLAWSRRTPGNPFFDVFAVTMYGNGGMNTDYRPIPRLDGGCGGPGFGIFCAGRTGVNLEQMMMSVAVAKTILPGLSVGVAPIFLSQKFKAEGLQAFSGASLDPSNLTNRGSDVAYGGGIRAGIEWAITPSIRFGAAGTTPIWSQKIGRYSGLFAEGGGFDVPASVQAGFAFDLTPRITLMTDYRRIFYSSVDSISNPSTNIFGCMGDPSFCLGGANGPGFGWDDINVYKIGLEVRQALPGMDLRLGYAYNDKPYSARDVMFNVLAPGIVQHHFTAGTMFRDVLPKLDVELAAAFVPTASVSGAELPGFGNPFHRIGSEMWQLEATIGLKYRYGEPDAPLK